MQLSRAREQYAFGFEVGWIGDATIDGAYCGACFVIVEADAFGAFGGDDVIDVLRDSGAGRAVKFPRNAAGIDCRVGAFGLASSAVDTFAGDRRRHLVTCVSVLVFG